MRRSLTQRATRTLLDILAAEARACQVCAAHLPLGPKPVFLVGAGARLMIVGQAPGRRVHETGIPWNDPSGDHLREWLRMDRAHFYDRARIAIVPTGLCYPGTGERGDLPPRPECAPLWHPRFRAALPDVRLTLLVGMHAQAYYLAGRRKKTMALTVRAYREYLPEFFPLPHPSPRNRLWMKNNPWFARSVVAALRREVRRALNGA
ncbi:MAG TPA: uracil-DNA glycosylase family protein [Burkholderiales bacterium]|nr:uracil-DNA glycosylase family protein [Burkholderiales bacterium]